MFLREMRAGDGSALARIFYDAVHIIAAQDYSLEQRNAWCPECPADDWAAQRFANLTTFVALTDVPVGFMNVDRSGYIDLAFVARSAHGKGVAYALYKRIESSARAAGIPALSTFASHTAKPFFLRQGFDVTRANVVRKGCITIDNWHMAKAIRPN